GSWSSWCTDSRYCVMTVLLPRTGSFPPSTTATNNLPRIDTLKRKFSRWLWHGARARYAWGVSAADVQKLAADAAVLAPYRERFGITLGSTPGVSPLR